jgi:hypothetical protein
MTSWYVRRGEHVLGPIEAAKLKALSEAGKLLPSDLLAKDVAGPWTEASRALLEDRTQPPPLPQPLARRTEIPVPTPPPIIEPPPSKVSVAIQGGKILASAVGRGTLKTANVVGRGTLTTVEAIGRSLAERSRRRHELKLAKIQAEAARPQQLPSVVEPTAPIYFAPEIIQTTIIRNTNENARGCGSGCEGCALILLAILAYLIWSTYTDNYRPTQKHVTTPSGSTQRD